MPSPCSAERGAGSPRPRRQASRRPSSPCLPSHLLADQHEPACPTCAAAARSAGPAASRHRARRRGRCRHRLRVIAISVWLDACVLRAKSSVTSSNPAVSISLRSRSPRRPGCFLAVAGDAGPVVDNRDLPAREPVEQRRLADIRATDDGHRQRHFRNSNRPA